MKAPLLIAKFTPLVIIATLAVVGAFYAHVALLNQAHAQDSPSVAISLSPSGSVEPGTAITAAMSFGNLASDSDTSTTDYIFRADVVDADACEGGGMGKDRYFYQVNEDPETREATVSASCPAGDYTVRVSLSSAANEELASASADFSIAEPAPEPTLEPTPEPTPQPTPAPTSEPPPAPPIEVDLSPASPVVPGNEITVTMSFNGLEPDADTATIDYTFRADVLDSDKEAADECEGNGLGADRNINKVDEDPEVRSGTISADCSAGSYDLKVSIITPEKLGLALIFAFSIEEEPAVAPASHDAPTLTALSISHGDPAVDVELSPVFASATLEYDADVRVAQVTVAPTASDADATVAYLDGNGDAIADADEGADGQQVDLEAGSNTVKVAVSKDSLTTTYTVNLLRLVTQQQTQTDTTLVSNIGRSFATVYLVNSSKPKNAQSFTTGSNSRGYNLTSIGVTFGAGPSASSAVVVTIREDDSGDPSDTVFATLTTPATINTNSVSTFTAPADTVLAASTTYFVHIERPSSAQSNYQLRATGQTEEDSGAAVGWSITNTGGRWYNNNAWATRASGTNPRMYQIKVTGSAVEAECPGQYVSGVFTEDATGCPRLTLLDFGEVRVEWDAVPGATGNIVRYYMDVDDDPQWWTNAKPYPGVVTSNTTITGRTFSNLPREANVVYFSFLTEHANDDPPRISGWSPYNLIWINDPLELEGAAPAPDDVLDQTPASGTPGKPGYLYGFPSNDNGGRAYVYWDLPNRVPTGYQVLVEYSSGEGVNRIIITLESATTNYTYATLREGTRRTFRVRGVNATGPGAWSDPYVFVADREDDSYPRMPKGFTAYAPDKSSRPVEMSWQEPDDGDGVTGYRIVRATCGDMMDHRGFPIFVQGCVSTVRTQRDNVETEYTHNTHSRNRDYRYAVQWIKAGATAAEDVYSALSFIYRVTTPQ